ncbi:cysteine--tRNA ligase [Coriobacteriaceae bacterium]|uniref:Cysteine--tRNA ligase n=1 Tax=Granulimonas faecalis TaxID=2894155 RepID=A0AAV5B248_9ACTN|nr:cysteine--tRNA ligase [Granulimonas faecalis]MBF0599126.1 cysteine--tRNA ligase [Atopobiaceae bacterium FL090493]TGY58229.1 cysteine--tRNA ligase [Coriobacteriaceae bacterium]GJM54794.1 cysteine--tRNA ligase [Granulimonas faecalis]
MLVYNTQTHRKEELVPVEPGHISMYVCGPTVYDQIHIGNGRTFLAFDVIRRYLVYKGYQVRFAQNLTDVDDKIIQRANEEGVTAAELARTYSDAFIEQMGRLNVLAPDIRPRATQEIDAMVSMISGLIDQGNAYAVPSGDVYFSVRSCETYGRVSGRNVDELLVGARIEENSDKRDPLDFALWKAAKPGEPSWESPWGEGRPGWHTECAAMVHRYLGTPIDIHGGGSDLVFPHHENESAQACCRWHEPLANLWMHTGMLRVDGEKMSKSLGNFHTLKEVLDRYPADAVRLLMLQTHYRSSLDFSFERLDGCVGALERLRTTARNLRWAAENSDGSSCGGDAAQALSDAIDAARDGFTSAMDDDFNTSSALAAVFSLANQANAYLDAAGAGACTSTLLRASDTLVELLEVLGLESVRPQADPLPAGLVDVARDLVGFDGDDVDGAVAALVDARAAARAAKDWARADAIRDAVSDLGLVVEDTQAGTRITRQEGGR